jgi:hypothetical protein
VNGWVKHVPDLSFLASKSHSGVALEVQQGQLFVPGIGIEERE